MEFIEDIDIWKLLGGLGTFLFAMFTIEDAIRKLAGRSFKRFIRQQTEGRLRSILSGTIVTAVLQSSSAVSLMVLTFVGAGIMAIDNAIGVILGSNIGTTATAWIVATIGFKLDIEAFALPIIGIGGLILIFLGKSQWYSNFSKLLVSFGFLFMGLAFMKDSMEQVASSISIEDLPSYGIFTYVLVGTVLTAAMQSSSATIAIILTSVHAGLLPFEGAASMVIGANIGTTATVLIGGIRATQIKKRIAASHFIFNIVSAILGVILLWPLTWLITDIVGDIKENAVIGIALFHSIFNIVGVLFFLPFIGFFSKQLVRLIPDKKSQVTHFIQGISPTVYDAAVSGIKKEVEGLAADAMEYNLTVLGVHNHVVRRFLVKEDEDTSKQYVDLKILQSEIFQFATEVQNNELSKEENAAVVRLMHSARETLNAAKSIKDVEHNILDFDSQDNTFLQAVLENIKKRMINHYEHINEIISQEDHEEIANDAMKLLKKLRKEDRKYVKMVMDEVKNDGIEDLLLSEVLMVNREFIHSTQLFIHAILELKLLPEEIGFFENFID